MDGSMTQIATGIIIPVIPTLATFCVVYLRKKTAEIEQSINNKNINKYINIAEDAVCTAVNAVSQVMVDGLKKSNSFDQAAMEEAFNTARIKALTIMGTATQESLKMAFGDFDEWLNSKIEHYVATSKN